MNRISKLWRGRFRLRAVPLAIALVAVGATAVPAMGQGGRGRGEGRAQDPGRSPLRGAQGLGRLRGLDRLLEPDFVRRDMRLFVDHLRLDEDQSTVVETLLLDYEASYTAINERMREAMTELYPQADQQPELEKQREMVREDLRQIVREMRDARQKMTEGGEIDRTALEELEKRLAPLREKMRELRPERPDREKMNEVAEKITRMTASLNVERDALRVLFLDNLRAVLSEEQATELWPPFERALRREKKLRRGQLSGERVDLFKLLKVIGMGDDQIGGFEESLDAYAIELDLALVARENHLAGSDSSTMDAMRDNALERALSIARREAELRVAVRNVNEQYLEVLAIEIGAERGDALRTAFREEAFSRIYRTTQLQRAFEAVKDLETLDEDALIEILGLERAFLAELGAMNERLVDATRQTEPMRTVERLERQAERMRAREAGETGADPRRGLTSSDPVRELMQERGEIESRYRAILEGLLTPEQIAELPEVRQPRQRGGEAGQRRVGMRDGGDGMERMNRALERWDANGDGQLDEAERDAMRRELRDRGRRRGGGGQP